MRIAVAGIGGIGGILGGVLAAKGADTYFLVRGENLKAIRNNGLKVDSVLWGSFIARPAASSDNAADLGIMDAVFICCKGHALRSMCLAAAPMVGKDTLVVPLLNGVGVSDLMRPYLPECRLADGSIWVFSHIEGPGHVAHTSGKCRVVFGMKDGSRPDTLDKLASELNSAGIEARVSDNIQLDCWKKYLAMGGNSVLFCYYDGNTGEVRSHPEYKEVMRAIANEMISVAKALGINMPEDSADKYVENFSSFSPETINSLYRDLISGVPPEKTELDHLIGSMIRLGKETGVKTPYHEAAYENACRRYGKH
ncbi:MAG: 2-dehydropantoate 2-reductase [Synergistes sp.]|nr:2-dehydropantoate 2-reductase [Synergistes sp.]